MGAADDKKWENEDQSAPDGAKCQGESHKNENVIVSIFRWFNVEPNVGGLCKSAILQADGLGVTTMGRKASLDREKLLADRAKRNKESARRHRQRQKNKEAFCYSLIDACVALIQDAKTKRLLEEADKNSGWYEKMDCVKIMALGCKEVCTKSIKPYYGNHTFQHTYQQEDFKDDEEEEHVRSDNNVVENQTTEMEEDNIFTKELEDLFSIDY